MYSTIINMYIFSLSHYLFTEGRKMLASFIIWHCYWKFALRITKRNFWGNISRGRSLILHALWSSVVNLDKSTTLGTPLCKNTSYASDIWHCEWCVRLRRIKRDHNFFHTTIWQIQNWKVFLRRGIFVASFMWKKKSCQLQRKKEKVKDPMSLRENSVCLMQQGVCINWQQRKLVIAGVLCWKAIALENRTTWP